MFTHYAVLDYAAVNSYGTIVTDPEHSRIHKLIVKLILVYIFFLSLAK